MKASVIMKTFVHQLVFIVLLFASIYKAEVTWKKYERKYPLRRVDKSVSSTTEYIEWQVKKLKEDKDAYKVSSEKEVSFL